MRLVLVCGCVGGGQRLSADRLRAHTPACPPAHLQPSCRWAGPSSVQPPMGSPPVYPLYSAAAPAAPPSPLRVHLVAGCGGWELFALSSSSPSSPAPAVSLTAVNRQQIRHRMLNSVEAPLEPLYPQAGLSRHAASLPGRHCVQCRLARLLSRACPSLLLSSCS